MVFLSNMTQRIIKFRAWDTENKKMLPDSGMYFEEVTMLSESMDNMMKIKKSINFKEKFLADLQKKYPLMQFTGLLDKNGKEIYEGDILRSKENDEVWRVDEIVPLHRHSHVTNIGYFSGKKKYNLRENPAGRYDNMEDWMSWPEMYEIIGNIYETPELLQ